MYTLRQATEADYAFLDYPLGDYGVHHPIVSVLHSL